MSLIFVGLGLERAGISVRGLEEARRADAVYAEFYTSIVPRLSVEELQQLIGKPVQVVDRKTVEENPDEILRRAKSERVVFLVPGDPMVATTHVDLRLRAHRMNVQTEIVHAGSILSAVAGAAGLQSYKFGASATIPFPDNPSSRPYEILVQNKQRGLHTLLLLDFRAEERKTMTANQAIEIMLGLERKHGKKVFLPETLAVVVARVGDPDARVCAAMVRDLAFQDFGDPPHSLVVPGALHFMEGEALKVFGGAPADVVDQLVR